MLQAYAKVSTHHRSGRPFSVISIKLWNTLPDDIKKKKKRRLSSFKNALVIYFSDNFIILILIILKSCKNIFVLLS